MNIIKGLTLFGDIETVIEHSKLETKEKIMKVHTKKKKLWLSRWSTFIYLSGSRPA